MRYSLLVCFAIAMHLGAFEVDFSPEGLSTITVAGQQVLTTGTPAVWRLQTAADAKLSTKVEASTFDAATRTLTQRYAWGSLACRYRPLADALAIDVTLANTSAETLTEVHLSLLSVAGLGDDQRLSGTSFGVGEPPFVYARGANGALVWSTGLDSPPLGLSLNAATRDQIPVIDCRVQLGSDRILIDGLPLERPLAPGASDRFNVELRLGPAGNHPLDLAEPLIATYRDRYPPLLDWPDRRPILRLFFGGGVDRETAGANLRDPVAVVMPEPDAAFRKRIIDRMHSLIAAAKRVDAQGVILWDLEGDTFPHPTTYIGDPRLVRLLNPQMELVIDDAMAILREAGLRVGVTLRPTQVVYSEQKGTAVHSHTDAKDPFLALDAKVAYVRERWGCTLIYVDTNYFWRPYGEAKTWKAGKLQADVWRRLHAKYPDVLFIPEIPAVDDYQATAPYGEADMGNWGTPELMRRLWPDAWRVIVIEDADPVPNHDRFVACIRQGNALMTYAYSPSLHYVVGLDRIQQEAKLLHVGAPEAVTGAALAALPPLLASPELPVRFFAARRLAETPYPEAAAALLKTAFDEAEDWLVRRQALLALRHCPVPGEVPRLLALLPNRELGLWHAAAVALGGQGPEAVNAVAAMLDAEVDKEKPSYQALDALASALRAMQAADRLEVAAARAEAAGKKPIAERLRK